MTIRPARFPDMRRVRPSPPEKSRCKEKFIRKSTYPPPADGLRVLFLCKCGCSANNPAAQAGRGALQGIGHFILCKVLQRNAARLHGGAGSGREGGIAQVPGFIGRKIIKRGNGAVFRIVTDLFEAAIHLERIRGNSSADQAGRGLRADWGISQRRAVQQPVSS